MTLNISGYYLIFFYFFYFVNPFFSIAQIKKKGIPFITHFSTGDYNAAPDSWQITQDKGGVMYFGNNGLLQFDGTTWQLFPIPNNTIVRSIAIDSSGKIYVGAQGEFGYFLPDSNGSLKYFSLSNLLPKNLKRHVNDIWKIFINENDEVIFQDRYSFFVFKNGHYKVVRSNSWMSFAQKINKDIYVGIDSIGLHQYKNGELKLVKNGDYFKGYKVISVLPYDSVNILILNEKEGLTFYDGQKFTLWKTDINQFVIENQVESALCLKDGYYAIGTWKNGLLIFDKQGKPIQHLNNQKGLHSDIVYGLHQDIHKNLWITTSNGIDHLEISSPFTYFNDHLGVPGSSYASILYDDKLFFATNLGIYWKKLTGFDNPIDNGSNFKLLNNGKALAWNLEIFDNTLFGEMHSGLHMIKSDSAIQLKGLLGAWKILPLKGCPGYFIKGCYQGLVLYYKEKDKITFIKKFKNFEESGRIIEQDNDGTIWVSHAYKGVYRILIDNDLKEITSVDFFNTSQGLPTDISIYVFRINNEIVFTSPKGIFMFNRKVNRFEPSKKWNQLIGCTNRHVKRLVEDKNGNIFYFMDDQLGVLYKKGKGIYEKNESIFAGFKGELVKDFEHINPIDSNNIIIGTKDYFVHLDPSIKLHSLEPFLIHIRKVELFNNKILFGGSYISNKGFVVANQPNEMIPKLYYNQNAIRLNYSAACYSDNKIEYSYLLEGFDDEWSSWSDESKKDYTNLYEGEYIFKVKARSSYGNETDVSSYVFIISPPWYRTYFAYFLYVVFIVLVLIVTIKMYTRRLRKDNEKLEVLIEERTSEVIYKNKEMEKQNIELQELNEEKNYLMSVLSHDLRTPVKQVKGLASIIKMGGARSKEEEINLLGKIIECTDRLNQMISDILNWKSVDAGKINFKIEQLDVSSFVKEVKESFRILARDKSIELIFEGAEKCWIQVDKNYFTQILENLISNAIKFSPSEKKIFINVLRHKDKIRVEVRDEGPGLTEEDMKKLFSPYQKLSARPTAGESSTGLGLSIVKKYVEAMGGKVYCESVEGEGANFIIAFTGIDDFRSV